MKAASAILPDLERSSRHSSTRPKRKLQIKDTLLFPAAAGVWHCDDDGSATFQFQVKERKKKEEDLASQLAERSDPSHVSGSHVEQQKSLEIVGFSQAFTRQIQLVRMKVKIWLVSVLFSYSFLPWLPSTPQERGQPTVSTWPRSLTPWQFRQRGPVSSTAPPTQTCALRPWTPPGPTQGDLKTGRYISVV